MAECPDGRTNPGTRSQFRIGFPGLGFPKGFYPVNLGKIMDVEQSSQISSSTISSSPRDLLSPCKGSHTLTVREYEQTIDELKKENFNLKLKLYLCEETHKKASSNKDSSTPNDEMVQIIISLSTDQEALRAELKHKEELLQDALKRIEKLESDCKELEKLNVDLQTELTTFSELPTKEEISLLLEEKENIVSHVQSLENFIKEKEEEIDILNQKIEILANENTRLDEKLKKRSIAIEGFVYKSCKENELLPREMKNIVISAAQAAKKKNKAGVAEALKTFTSALNNIMSTSELSLNQTEEQENIGSPTTKCLTEETLEKFTDSFLANQTASPSQIAHIQDLKEVFSNENSPDTKHIRTLDSFAHRSYIRGKMVHQNAVNISEHDVIDFCDISLREENLSFSRKPGFQTCSPTEINVIDYKNTLPSLYKLISEKDTLESDNVTNILKENEQLKHDLEGKLALMKNLQAVCEELKGMHLQEIRSDASKASQQCCVSTQTNMIGSYILDEYEIGKLEKKERLSDNVEELQETVLSLLLAVEKKNKELSEVKQSFAAVQDDLKKTLNTTSSFDKEFYMNERNELHERLASSCSVNEKLIKHLKSLQNFMEDLLQHKFDNSLESITDESDFMTSLSKCLNESLNLSKILSDNLSICEGSKLFEECESLPQKNSSYSDEKGLFSLSLDKFTIPEKSNSFGARMLEEYISYARKNSLKVAKESDSSQLCWRCCQQLKPLPNQSEFSHVMQNNSILKPVRYQSSDSDIWSEPDRNVSMQRIGISLQNSPVSSKSPRRLKQKDKRLSSRISSKEDTSSSEYLQASKKRQGPVSRRLSPKTQDSVLDKFYFLVSEKSSRMKSLLDELGSVEDGKISNDSWLRLNMIVMAVEDAQNQLNSARENAKTSPVCGKCVMLELFSNIKTSYKETDFYIDDSFEQEILQQFFKELCLLKEACKEPFSLLKETVSRKSKASQSDIPIESKELESVINDLTARKEGMEEKLGNIEQILLKEREELESVKAENSRLLNKIDNLKIDCIDMKYKEKELLLKNENLVKDLACANENNSELEASLKVLEQKTKESASALNQLTTELEKKKSDLNQMTKKCLEIEKQLNEQIHMTENSENKLKTLESESLKEKNCYLRKIEELKTEKTQYIQEFKNIQEKRLILEKENAVVNDRLQSKNNELLTLRSTIEKLQNIKEAQKDAAKDIDSSDKVILESLKTENFKLSSEVNRLKEELLDIKCKEKELSLENKKVIEELDHVNKNYSELNNTFKDIEKENKEARCTTDQLKVELKKRELDLSYMSKKCVEYEKQLNEQTQMKEKYESQLKTLEVKSSNDKKNYQDQLDRLNAEKDIYEQEMKDIQERVVALEKENAVINSNLLSRSNEISSLRKSLDILAEAKKSLISDREASEEDYLNQIKTINEEKNLCVQELRIVQEKVLALVKENAAINSNLQSKNYELSSLRKKVETLENAKEILISNYETTKESLTKSKESIESTEIEKRKLLKRVKQLEEELSDMKNKVNQLEEELSHMRNKEQDLCIENNKLVADLTSLSENNSKLEASQKDLEQKSKKSALALDQLTAELEKHKSDLINMIEKCTEYEKQLSEQLQMKENSENKLKILESELLSSKNYYLQKINDLNTEKNHYEQELKTIQEHRLTLEKENAVINDRLKSKNDELLSLKRTMDKLQSAKEIENGIENESFRERIISESIKSENSRLSKEVDHLKEELLSMKCKEKELTRENKNLADELDHMNTKYSEIHNTLEDFKLKNKESHSTIDNLNKNCSEYEKQLKEQNQMKEKVENELKILNLNSLAEKENYTNQLNFLNAEKKHFEEELENIKTENCKLSNQINQLEEELSQMKHKEKEICVENEKLIQKLNEITKNNSELISTLKILEQKKKEIDAEFDHLTAELQKNKSDLAHLSEKCLVYKKQLQDQAQMKERSENELKTERKDYLNQINKLNAEKDQYLQEIKSLQERKLHLEKEISAVNNRLQSKNNEHLSLQKTVEELRVKQLNEQSQLEDKYEKALKNEMEDYAIQIKKLKAENDFHLQKLESITEKKVHLEKEIGVVKDRLQSKNNELLSLHKSFDELQEANKTISSNYEELRQELLNSRECQTNLQEKCKTYEEVIAKLKEVELEYSQQLKQLEAKSKSAKEFLSNEISVLTKEKEDLLQKLKNEKECCKKLLAENLQLNENCLRSSNQISALKQKNEFFENALFSSNKECDSLNEDLKSLRNTLQNLEAKCLRYEKQLVATAGMKDNLTKCLLNINNDFSLQRQRLNEMCKIYGKDDSVVWDENSFTKSIPAIDEDNLSKICDSIISETKKLSQSVDILFSILKSYHLKSIETESLDEKSQTKTQGLKKEVAFYKTEVEKLHIKNDHLQHIIDELQKSVSEKEKLIQYNDYHVKNLEEKLQNSEKKIDRGNQHIQRRDHEITMLQEKIFNLQTYVNGLMTEKRNMLEKATSIIAENSEDSIPSSNLFPSKAILTDTKMCQTDECENVTQNLDESFSSISSLEFGKKRCCEKYWKKCYSLQTKLAIYQKRIEILEKDKDDLKERLLQQLQSKKDSLEGNDSIVSKLVELESKLEKKNLFIREIKNELLNTCNSLINKEKEVDDLKQKLEDCKSEFKYELVHSSKTHPNAPMTSLDANVNSLKNHKWELIQTIFDLQTKFYKKKGIHLNYFDKFKEHVNSLYLQLIPPVSRSESMPLLRSEFLAEQYQQGNEKIRKLADLELDIECLENLKIFLNRFLVPCVFETPDAFDKQIEIKQKAVSSDQLPSLVKIDNRNHSSHHELTDILNLSFPEALVTSDKEKNVSLHTVASTVFLHIDCIKKFLDAVTEKNWSEVLNLSVEDSDDKAEVKSLLFKIFQEINILHKGAIKLFNFNEHLRSFEFIASLKAPISMTKLDSSDRESIMSEETIAVSRTESPLSFEDACPIKLPHPDTLQLEEKTVKSGLIGNRVTVIEPYSTKTAITNASCDSVCQRSHYSSPDLGIESDPNHESSAPEHKDDVSSKYQKFPFKHQLSKAAFTNAESAGRWPGPEFGETFYAVSTLPHFELLKQEIKESLVAIKSVLSRTGDGLHHIAKYTSPRKTLEYNTLKSIKDTCVHMEVCLREANNLVGNFWTAPCPTEKEWKMLTEENQKLSEDLACLRSYVEKQEKEFKEAMEKAEHAQAVKENMEKKISKKLVSTKKVIRRAELKLLENMGQNFLSVPKYPLEKAQQADAQ